MTDDQTRLDAFLADLAVVCQRHGMIVTGVDDLDGPFVVRAGEDASDAPGLSVYSQPVADWIEHLRERGVDIGRVYP